MSANCKEQRHHERVVLEGERRNQEAFRKGETWVKGKTIDFASRFGVIQQLLVDCGYMYVVPWAMMLTGPPIQADSKVLGVAVIVAVMVCVLG